MLLQGQPLNRSEVPVSYCQQGLSQGRIGVLYIAKSLNVLVVTGLLHHGPRLFGKLVRDMVQVELALLLAVFDRVSCQISLLSGLLHPVFNLCVPSFLQFLQTEGPFSGQAEAWWPT